MSRTITIEPEFVAWRDRARALLAEGAEPGEVFWSDRDSGQEELFAEPAAGSSLRVREEENPAASLRVPRAFLGLAETVACHSDPERWGLLYRLLWRLVRGGERHLLVVATDPDVRRASAWAREVGRDIHKMRAFVRFRKVGESESGREQFVSWFEPSHHIVRRNAPFFRKRFAGMDWSILTPGECAHWDGEQLRFTPGVPRSEAPDEDALEDLWRNYYRSIFNPARLKLKAMQSEMPAKYWKNLPEAPLIAELTREASQRREEMIERSPRIPKPAPDNLYLRSLEERNEAPRLREIPVEEEGEETPGLDRLRELASCCRACPLWERATRTVFGEGPEDAEIMIVGEQPGDREDIEGRPFVGPAGQLLDEALAAAGIDRKTIYVTNAVKHFKWKSAQGGGRRRGPARLHDKANRAEMKACRPWLLGEIANVRPRLLLVLGNTAGQSVVGPDFRVLRDRGEVTGECSIPFEGRVFATVHPSFLLRIREADLQVEERERFFREIAEAVTAH